jgi:hypothetical protein
MLRLESNVAHLRLPPGSGRSAAAHGLAFAGQELAGEHVFVCQVHILNKMPLLIASADEFSSGCFGRCVYE